MSNCGGVVDDDAVDASPVVSFSDSRLLLSLRWQAHGRRMGLLWSTGRCTCLAEATFRRRRTPKSFLTICGRTTPPTDGPFSCPTTTTFVFFVCVCVCVCLCVCYVCVCVMFRRAPVDTLVFSQVSLAFAFPPPLCMRLPPASGPSMEAQGTRAFPRFVLIASVVVVWLLSFPFQTHSYLASLFPLLVAGGDLIGLFGGYGLYQGYLNDLWTYSP